jgi:uncharacterized protein (TIGR02268 family)
VFSFDSDLVPGSVRLEGHEGFARVEPGPSTLKLLPSKEVPLGKALRVTVDFADKAVPSSATFVLVVHAEEAAALVEVHRYQRTAESLQRELRAKEEETRQLREEVARLRADRTGTGGLRGLLASGVIGTAGVASQDIAETITAPPMPSLRMGSIWGYRSSSRVAVTLELRNLEGASPWTTAGATLQDQRGVSLQMLPVWQEAPTVPGKWRHVVVEAEAPSSEARGPFTLRLWEADGTRSLVLGGVTFP